MSDTSTSSEPSEDFTERSEASEPLWVRFLYMLGFGVLAHIAFSLTLFLGVVQIVLLALRKGTNEELMGFSRGLIAYIGQCLGFIVFISNEKPFPLGKFPSIGE
tara:strand:+ start:22264 stop:22575 length:312 start_codon:yes stop_codon:yes gene_type:complete